MKQQFFVLVECSPGKAYDVAEKIMAMDPPTVSAAYSTSGVWDLLLRVEFDAGKNFGEAVSRICRDVPGIVNTHTVIGYPIWDADDIDIGLD